MRKSIHKKVLHAAREAAGMSFAKLDANELKELVRDGLVAMNASEREEFIRTLEAQMSRAGLDIRKYLVPLGIPARSPEELTPTEVAHLLRFLKLNVAGAMRAIERALAPYTQFGLANVGRGHRIAA